MRTFRYGFTALDRGDDARLKARMERGPFRENGIKQRAARAKAWATRRAKAER